MSRAILGTRASASRCLSLGIVAVMAAGCASSDRGAGVSTDGDWTFITGNMAGQRYTQHTQINPSNFADLEVAWE